MATSTTIDNFKTPLGFRYPVECITISPLHVGGNSTLSPLSDYFIENNVLHILDSNRLADLLEQKGKIDAYLEMVKKAGDANEDQKGLLLKNFLRNNLQVQLKDCASEISYPAYIIGNSLEIDEFIKSDGNPFLPGSSIKGAIRTTLLFEWLSDPNNLAGRQAIIDWANELIKMYDNDMTAFRKGVLFENNFKRNIEEAFFGKLDDKLRRLPMSNFKITDSIFFENNALSVYEIVRFSLTTGKPDIPVIKECIDEYHKSNFLISLDYENINQNGEENYSKILKPYSDPQKLCDVINNYSKAVLKYEISVMESDGIINNAFKKYEVWIRDLLASLESPGNNSAFIRIGAGKMQHYQTMAMILFEMYGKDEDADNWIYYLGYCNGFPNSGVSSPYPITRSLTANGQVPLGWVKLNIQSN